MSRYNFLIVSISVILPVFWSCSNAMGVDEIVDLGKNDSLFVSSEKEDGNIKTYNVGEIWQDISGIHKVKVSNIKFVKKLLRELKVDTLVLSEKKQAELRQSLNIYLKQYSSHFKQDSELAEGYNYWIAWLISNGCKRKDISIEEEKKIRLSHKSFFDEIIISMQNKIRKDNGEEVYRDNKDLIEKHSELAKNALNSYYSKLHKDFLYIGFKKTVSEKHKKEILDYINNLSAPILNNMPNKRSKSISGYFFFLPISTMQKLAWYITLEEAFVTKEWGLMKVSANSTATRHKGKEWPTNTRIKPYGPEVTAAYYEQKRLDEEKQKRKEKEIKK